MCFSIVAKKSICFDLAATSSTIATRVESTLFSPNRASYIYMILASSYGSTQSFELKAFSSEVSPFEEKVFSGFKI